MSATSRFTVFISAIFRRLVLHEDLMALVNELLFALDVLEHVLALGHAHIVWKHLRVVLVELEHARQPILRLLERVEALEILREVVKDQVLFEDRNDVPLLVVHDIGRYLGIVVLLRCQVLRIQRSLCEALPKLMLVCLHEQGLCAGRPQPIDTRKTVSLVDDPA